MNQKPNYQPIDPDLEAQIVAFVLGESSDDEREQIQLLMEEQPELVEIKQHYENVHRLMRDVGSGESMVEDEPWKLPAEKRERVLSVISGKAISETEKTSRSWLVSLPPRLTPHLLKRIASVAAVLCMVVTAGMMLLPATQMASRSPASVRYSVDAIDGRRFETKGGTTMTYDAPASASEPAPEGKSADFGNEVWLEESESAKEEMQPEKQFRSRQNAPARRAPATPEFERPPQERSSEYDDETPDAEPTSTENGYSNDGVGIFADGAKGKAGESIYSLETVDRYSRSTFKADKKKRIRDADLVIPGYPARRGRIMLGGAVNSDAGDETGDVSDQRTNELNRRAQLDSDIVDRVRGLDVDHDRDGVVDSITLEEPGLDDLFGVEPLGDRGGVLEEEAKSGAGGLGGGQGGGRGEKTDTDWGWGGAGGRGFSARDSIRLIDGTVGSSVEDLSEEIEPEEALQQQGQASAGASINQNGRERDSDERFRGRYAVPSLTELATRGKSKETKPQRSERTQELNASDQPFSTFSLHVSDVSFKIAQAALSRGQWPDATKIRIEEFVNAMDYGDPMPCHDEKVASQNEQAIHPFLQQRNVLRVSMRTAAAGRASKTPLRLILLLDSSGSMERIDRRQTVKRAFESLTSQLKAIDEVTLISFARTPRLLAERVGGKQAGRLVDLIENLPSEGGTNLEAAIELAFEKAKERQADDAQSRIILLTDGAVNLGDANPESLLELITSIRDEGIAFDAAGISANGLNDEVLEAMTRNGDGRYYLLDSDEDADDGFANQIAGALRPSAKNVKVQIEFNPRRVGRYQLLGFEKHILNKEDFRNDAVDAAEMAAAESGVAVYQFEPRPDGEGDIGTVSVRFRDLSTGEMIENRWPIPYQPAVARIENAAPSLRIATTAALFAAALRGDALGQSVDLKTLSDLMASLPEEQLRSKRVKQLSQMIQEARQVRGQ